MSAEPDPDTEAPERTLAPAVGAELVARGAEVIDVRTAYEFDAGHLPGARRIEMNELTPRAAEVPRDRPVLFVCRTGNRSGMAADAFREGGWDAHNLEGGIEGWANAGQPIEPEGGEVRPPRPPSADGA